MKSVISLLAAVTVASAQHVFYSLQLFSPSGINITQFGGTFTVPEYPPGYPNSSETYYLFSGLQSTSVGGVFQQVMSPQQSGGTWSIDSGDYPYSEFQGGISNLEPGQQIYYNNFDNGNGQWTTQFAYAGQPVTVTDDWPTSQNLSFNVATWTIELYSAPWNFGQFLFTDVFLVWNSTDTSACCNGCVHPYNSFSYTVKGASASVDNGYTTCTFSQISLDSPNN